MQQAIFGNGKPPIKIPASNYNEREIKTIIGLTLKKCTKKLKSKIVHIFIFPNFNKFKKEKMNGVGGFCSWKNTILLDINPVKGWQNALKRSLCHEFHHSVIANKRKPPTWTLLESLIYEGMADNFAESITQKTSIWCKTLSKQKSMAVFQKIKKILNKNDDKTYQQVFFGKGKKYPRWAGYSIGYQVVKSSLKIHPNFSWNEMAKIRPEKILKDSIFGKF